MKEIKMLCDRGSYPMNTNIRWLIIGVLFLVFSFWSNWALAQEVKGPKMVLKEDSVDLKEVKEGETLEYAFKVLNEGDQTLEIKNVKPG
jgi:type VI protein secretion system component VasK